MKKIVLLFALSACVACSGADQSTDGDDKSTIETEKYSGSDKVVKQRPVGETPSGEDSGEWLLHGLSGGEQRYSPLDQINIETIGRIGLAFEFSDITFRGRTHRGMQATPLMEDGVLYFTGPWAVVYAINARDGRLKWSYDPRVEGQRARVACCDMVNRGVALKGDKIIVATTDGYLVALNKKTGAPVWKVDTFIDRNASYTITGAPRLAGDKVVIGNGGAEMGVRGYVTAYNVETGAFEWRFFTVPGAGPDETVDVTRARETWSETTKWEFGGGGTAWDSMVYDEELDIIYVGVGNGSPWPAWMRSGDGSISDNLYLSSIVALDAKTGLTKWHYQTTPGDSWDYTATQHMILADIDIRGEMRKVIMQAPKNGFFYVLDRVTGQLLSANNFVPVSWASHVDLNTGRPAKTDNGNYAKERRMVAPLPGGGHNWPPMSYHPDTGLVYFATIEASAVYETFDDGNGYIPFSRNNQALNRIATEADKDKDFATGLPEIRRESRFIAWDPVAGAERWRSEKLPAWAGGMLSTAGNLVIGGTVDGRLNFYEAYTGELLKSVKTGTSITAPPMTYELDGVQYIAVAASRGGVALRVAGSLSKEYENMERLLVFKLDGKEVPMPAQAQEPIIRDIPSGLPRDPELLALGKEKFDRFCVQCHLQRSIPSGYPDLWNLDPTSNEWFDMVVLEGAFQDAGMPQFDDVLTPSDTLAIRAYIADDRQRIRDGLVTDEIGIADH